MLFENPGKVLEIHMKLELSIFLEKKNDYKSYGNLPEVLLPQVTFLEDLNCDYEKSWKSYGKCV